MPIEQPPYEHGELICLIAQETRQHSLDLCEHARVLQETAQELRRLARLARESRVRQSAPRGR